MNESMIRYPEQILGLGKRPPRQLALKKKTTKVILFLAEIMQKPRKPKRTWKRKQEERFLKLFLGMFPTQIL